MIDDNEMIFSTSKMSIYCALFGKPFETISPTLELIVDSQRRYILVSAWLS